MIRARIPILGSILTGVLVAGLVAAIPAQAAGSRYVALGDSYSSGVGSGSYISSSGSCLRSTLAYSQLWANTHRGWLALAGAGVLGAIAATFFGKQAPTTLS